MKKITMYIAEDGTQFEDEKNCVLYERKQKAKQQEIDNLLRSAKRIKEICGEHYDYEGETGKHPCASCPIWNSDNKTLTARCPFMFETRYEDFTPFEWSIQTIQKHA